VCEQTSVGTRQRFTVSVKFHLLALIVALFIYRLPVTARGQQSSPADTVSTGTLAAQGRVASLRGWVAEVESHSRIEGVRIELHATTGVIVGETFTRGNGDFEFDNVPTGTYNLIVETLGYQTVSQQVQVSDGPDWGIAVELRRPIEAAAQLHQGSMISVRELSIPQKARDAMEKGMAIIYKKSDYQGSIKQFQRAIQAYPFYYEAYAYMGMAYEKLGDASTSEQALRKSVELSEGHYLNALCLLAALLSDSGRFADAEPIARNAVDLDANSWQANSALGSALLGLNRNKEAEVNATAAVKLQPNNPMLRLILANVHIKLRSYLAVLDDLNVYLQLDPIGTLANQVRVKREEIQSAISPAQASTITLSTPER
jgi:Tfp pilus assembly protein PilF